MMSRQPEIELIELQKQYIEKLLMGKIPVLTVDDMSSEHASASASVPVPVPVSASVPVPVPGTNANINNNDIGDHLEEAVRLFHALIKQLDEVSTFSRALCRGDLDVSTPSRRNYIAAPLKELHTQLASLAWSMEQLAKGNVVSRLYYRGVLFESFNSLIDKVASVSNQLEATPSTRKTKDWEWSVNSWRYHQILSALNNLRIMVIEVAADGKIVYANRPAREYFGDIEYLSCFRDGSVAVSILEWHLAQVSANKDKSSFPVFHEICDESSKCWYKITSDRVHFSDTRMGYLHMVDNISEWKKHESTLKQTASTDPLTGIYNRGYGLKALQDAVGEARKGVPCCAAFIDLDGLKLINDVYGHTEGDFAIKSIAQVLTTSVRDKLDIVARFGGDEFIVIFSHCTEQFATQAISRMHNKLDELNSDSGKEFNVGFSDGVITLNGTADEDLQQVIDRMDKIMYTNKAEKKRLLQNGYKAIG